MSTPLLKRPRSSAFDSCVLVLPPSCLLRPEPCRNPLAQASVVNAPSYPPCRTGWRSEQLRTGITAPSSSAPPQRHLHPVPPVNPGPDPFTSSPPRPKEQPGRGEQWDRGPGRSFAQETNPPWVFSCYYHEPVGPPGVFKHSSTFLDATALPSKRKPQRGLRRWCYVSHRAAGR